MSRKELTETFCECCQDRPAYHTFNGVWICCRIECARAALTKTAVKRITNP